VATILVVDDYPVTARILSFILQKHNYDVVTANNGCEALDILAHGNVDLAIVDMVMPEMDGMTLLRQLRADTRYGNLPVIMFTASGQEQDRLAARLEGADAFLTKPGCSWQLSETVSRLLHADRSVADLTAVL
jgi:CheY-like chemotaxis protein